MIAAFNKFNAFVADVCNGVHNLSTDTLQIALTAVAPVAANSVLADLTEVSYTNFSSRALVTVSSSQAGGLYKLIANDLVLTATGAVAAFQYVVIYNNSAAAKNLIAWFDYGSLLALNSGDSFTFDLDNVNGILNLT